MKRLRVGISAPRDGRRRAKARKFSLRMERSIGVVTSGGFGPTVGGPVAMGYVDAAYRRTGTATLQLIVRGKPLPAKVADMPFAPHRYYRG